MNDKKPSHPLSGVIAALEQQNIEDFLVSMIDGSPACVSVDLAGQGEFIRQCAAGLARD